MLSRLRRMRAGVDAGFTLIELLVSISILTIVMITLTGMVFEYMRQTNGTSTRLNESSDQQFVSAYWQQDVSSLGLHGVPVGGVIPSDQAVWVGSSPNCSVANPVVSFSWRDYKNVDATDPALAWTQGTLNTAVYYTSTAGGQTILHRKRCGQTSDDTSSDIVLARYLTAVPEVTCADKTGAATGCAGSSPYPASVSIKLVVQDLGSKVHGVSGYTTTLTAQRRQG